MKPFFILFSLLLSQNLHAWDMNTHMMITEESLKGMSKAWQLDAPIVITPFDSFLKKLVQVKPEIKTREDFAAWIKINPRSVFDQPWKEEKIGATTTPLRTLTLYAPRPDEGRDRGLPYDPLEQFWFGSGGKADSQAFRHMQKVPFDLFHPLNTSGFPLGTIGQASERAQIYFDLALLANKLGEPYWAWNFLGCALHYIEDLHQPLHTTQVPAPFAWEGFKLFLKSKDHTLNNLLASVAHIIANNHYYLEGYIEFLFLHQTKSAELWVHALQGETLLEKPLLIADLARASRDFANRYVTEIIETIWTLTGNNLKESNSYKTNTLNSTTPQDPIPLLNPNREIRDHAAFQVSQIVIEDFTHQGKAVRTTVQAFLDQTKKQ